MSRASRQEKTWFMRVAGWMGHIISLLVEGLTARGWSDERIYALTSEQGREDRERLIDAVVDLLTPTGIVIKVTVEDLAYELPDWGEGHAPDSLSEVTPGRYAIDLQEFLVDDEPLCGGEDMLIRAKLLKARLTHGQIRALARQRHLIPAEIRDKIFIIATGTIVRDSDSDRYVSALGTDGGVGWFWLGDDFDRGDRLGRARKVLDLAA